MCRLISLAALTFCLTTILVPDQLAARDDGRFANSPLKPWFDRLASGKGLCCSFADGFSVQDVDWNTQDGHYRVRIYGPWLVVPDDAVVTEPNRFGPAVVWPYNDRYGDTQIRCFMCGHARPAQPYQNQFVCVVAGDGLASNTPQKRA
jgi:hypothetical protein